MKFRRVKRHPSWGNCMQIKLHAHATEHTILWSMQFWQDGCHSTRLDFTNAVLWAGRLQAHIYIPFCKLKIRLTFPFYFLKFPLYIQKGGALQRKCLYNPHYCFVSVIFFFTLVTSCVQLPDEVRISC